MFSDNNFFLILTLIKKSKLNRVYNGHINM